MRAALLLLLPACGARDPICGDVEPGAAIALQDASVYGYSGAIAIERAAVAPGADVRLDWSGLTQDLQGHPLDPVADVDSAALVLFRYLSAAEVEAAMAADALNQSDVWLYASADPGDATTLSLSALETLGTPFDHEAYLYAEQGTWLVLLATGRVPGVGTRAALFLEPTDGEEATEATIGDDSTVLSVEVDLEALDPVGVPAGTPDVVVDWSGLEQDGRGGSFDPTAVDEILVGHFADATPAELESDFLDLERVATSLWTVPLDGEPSASLASLEGFSGVTGDGTWLLALRCTTCANPAPPYLTVLYGCE